MRLSLLLLLAFSLLISCKKKGKADFVIKGLIVNSTSSLPHSNASVQLYALTQIGGNSTLIQSTSTNSAGEYSFSFPRDIVISYKIICEKNLYFTINESINFSDLTIEQDNIRNYSTNEMAWAKLRFINQSPSPSDILSYVKTEGKSNCDVCCPSDEVLIIGVADTTIYCPNNANTNYSYSFNSQGTGFFGDRSIITPAFDTAEIVLTY